MSVSGEHAPRPEPTESSTLARIDIARADAPTPASAGTSRVLSVSRITTPAFEVVYRDRAGAREHGEILQRERVVRLDRPLDEPPGTEVVLELTVADSPFSVTLLFRVVAGGPQHTVLEWWARRQTDPELLALWIQSLDATSASPTDVTSGSAPEASASRAERVQSAIELYRRTLASNPFDVLGVHWTADASVIAQAESALLTDMEAKLAACGNDAAIARYLDPSVERVRAAAAALKTLDGRRRQRAKVVPERERAAALQQARYLLQVAERSGREESVTRARAMVDELMP